MDDEEARALKLDVNRVKQAILEAVPADEVPIVVIIIALAELQKAMALLLFEEGDNGR